MECSVREPSCSFPLQRQLHALCQRGASGGMCSLRRLLLRLGTRRNSRKARAITVLLIFLSGDFKSREEIFAAVINPSGYGLRAELGKAIGKRDSIWGRLRIHAKPNRGQEPRVDPRLTWMFLA